MRYINPKTDFAFKKIFGSPGSQGILRSFLNAVLYEGLDRIASLVIVDPYSVPRLEGMKDSYLDVRAVLDDGQHVIIEMQVLNVPGLEKRVLYNAAKEYSNQLVKGEEYNLLNPVIALTLTDFIMFPELEDQVISRFSLIEKSRLISYPDGDVELVFVELPKFKRDIDHLRGLTDEWLYFVGAAADLEGVPERLSAVPEIGHAFHIAEKAGLTRDEDHALGLKTRWIADQKMILRMKLEAEAGARAAEAKADEAIAEAARAQFAEAKVKMELDEAKSEADKAKAKTLQLEADLRRRLGAASRALKELGLEESVIASKLGASVEEIRSALS